MRYRFIQGHRRQYPVALQCRVLKVSRSGFHGWQERERGAVALISTNPQKGGGEKELTLTHHPRRDRVLVVRIRAIFHQHRGRYGSPRIHQELLAQGIRCSRKRVARIMRLEGLQAQRPRRRARTTDSQHRFPVAGNLLERRFDLHEIGSVNRTWAGDITYIWTDEGFVYLAVLLDLYSRKVIGWSMSDSLEEELVHAALEMAVRNREPDEQLLHHSDRGSQYASNNYQARLAQNGLICSMSGKANCYDNAVLESFFATLKKELVHGSRFATRRQAIAEVSNFVEIYYNLRRRHSTLGYLTPAEFEARHFALSAHSTTCA